MSSFTEATFEQVLLPDGSPKLRRGRKVFAVRGRDGDGFVYEIGYLGSGLQVKVAEGLETDLGSDPTGVLDLTGVALYAVKSFALHDALRENGLFTKLATDAIFLMAMEAEEVPPMYRELIFAAVRTNNSRTRHNPDDLVFEGVEMPPY